MTSWSDHGEAKDRELGPGPPPDIDPDYEAAREAWISERSIS